ncbi:MAG: DUF3828 domain-containing protein [Chlorobiaceae bacterium]|nr:DUF3828 domain-containing protein [Chlorobiaceae bacterium]
MIGYRKSLLSFAMLLVGFLACYSPGITQVMEQKKSVGQFVKEFYDWYGIVSHQNSKLAPDERAITGKAHMFSAKLIASLKEDYEASSKHPDEIVGLDWDPFLCSQELEDRYEVGGVKKHGQNYLVEVYGVSGGKRNPEPNVIAEVEQRGDHWIFVNFHSPHGGDMLNDLKELKQSRNKSHK